MTSGLDRATTAEPRDSCPVGLEINLDKSVPDYDDLHVLSEPPW